MIQIIREIGIFIVIAQAVLYFVPGESYVKYVKVIIGIIMIARMAQPLLLLVNGREWELMLEEIPDFQSFSESDLPALEAAEEGGGRIGRNIERELLEKLAGDPAEGYFVRKVTLAGAGENGGEPEIVVTVSKEDEDGGKIRIERITVKEKEREETQWLREHYGKTLGTQPERIRVVAE